MAEPPVYFAYTEGRQVGPLRFAELADLAARSVLKPDDLVWQSGTPEWVAASSVLAFQKSVLDRRHADSPSVRDAALPERRRTAVMSSSMLAELARSGAPAGAATEAVVRPEPEGGTGERKIAPAPPFLLDVLSLRTLAAEETWTSPLTWVLLFFGLGPFVLSSFVDDPVLRVRLFNLGCGAAWTAFFVGVFRTPRQSLRLGLALFFATGVFALVFISLLQQVPPLSWMAPLLSPSRAFLVRLVATIVGVGFLEEAGKGVILVLLARALGGLENAADGLFYGLMAGLGFGVYESIAFTDWIRPSHAGALAWALDTPSAGLYAWVVGPVAHVVSLPFLQGVWSAILGCFIGLAASVPRSQNVLIGIGLLLVSVLHGFHEAFAATEATVFALLFSTLSLLFFLAIRKNADRVVAELVRPEGP